MPFRRSTNLPPLFWRCPLNVPDVHHLCTTISLISSREKHRDPGCRAGSGHGVGMPSALMAVMLKEASDLGRRDTSERQ